MTAAQKLIDEARDLLGSVRTGRPGISANDRSSESNLRVAEDEMARRAVEDQVEGSASVSIADDEMIAYVSLYPPQGFGRPLDPSDVYARLHEAGVGYGIESELVEAALFACNTERTALHSVEVAFADPPRHGVAEHLRLIEPESAEATVHGREPVDHRARSSLSLVETGAALAVVEPEVVGRDGTTVTGKPIPHQRRATPVLAIGENVEIVDGEVVAAIPGLLHVEAGLISVKPTLPLARGVDYHTGNIDFDGDVVLGGRVADGFTVACAGTLASSVTIDAFGITCGALTCSQGLIGHGDATVSVQNDATLRFVQNACIRVGGALRVTQSVLTSRITAYDSVELAHGSNVIGSTIRAGLGAVVFNIGSSGAAASEIYLGIDFGVDDRLAVIRDQTLALSAKLRDVRLLLSHGEQNAQLVELEQEVSAAIATLAEEAGSLVSQLDRDEDARLVVHGTIHAGTFVEICHRSHVVERSLSRCVLRLDRRSGSVVLEPLGAQTMEAKHDTRTGS
jgi:uncharacterized protein